MRVANQNIDNLSKKAFFQYQKLFPVLKKEKNKQYGILALTFITLTIFGVFALNPTITTIVELRKQLEDARFVEAQLTEKIANLQTLQQEYSNLGPDLELIENAVPKGPDTTKFLGQIQTIADNTGVSVRGLSIGALALTGNPSIAALDVPDNIRVAQTGVVEGINPFVFTLTVDGTYPQTKEFLDSLASFDRIIRIESIALSRESTSSSNVALSIQGAAFFTK